MIQYAWKREKTSLDTKLYCTILFLIFFYFKLAGSEALNSLSICLRPLKEKKWPILNPGHKYDKKIDEC